MTRTLLSAAGLGVLLAAGAAGAQQAAPATPAATATASATAAPTSRFDFSIANMMRGPEVYGRPDGQRSYRQGIGRRVERRAEHLDAPVAVDGHVRLAPDLIEHGEPERQVFEAIISDSAAANQDRNAQKR